MSKPQLVGAPQAPKPKPFKSQWTPERIAAGIQNADNAKLYRMLKFLYDRQTQVEQDTHSTVERNQRGFSGFDAQFLSSVAAKAAKYGSLTDKQAPHVRKRLLRYWRQFQEDLERRFPTPKAA
jgi:hypothetical protein